ncbi:hypothetical protein [Christiangramia sp.]|uniref:hypothetical protein n=1 Tax=Christiangramia sp. TaxID=1931228 RepID=UPI00260C6041|nr:hypothetical protein [Christiangramia sp.]
MITDNSEIKGSRKIDRTATLVGSNGMERGRNIFLFLETFYTENNQEKIEV